MDYLTARELAEAFLDSHGLAFVGTAPAGRRSAVEIFVPVEDAANWPGVPAGVFVNAVTGSVDVVPSHDPDALDARLRGMRRTS